MKGKEKGEDLSKWGALAVWGSAGAFLLSIIILLSFMLAQISSGLSTSDFQDNGYGRYQAEMDVDSFATISCSFTTLNDDEISISMDVMGPNGRLYTIDKKDTPQIFQFESDGSGTYEFILTVHGNFTIKDLEITIYSMSYGAVFMCCGVSSAGFLFIALLTTGVVLLIVGLYRRNMKEQPRQPSHTLPSGYYSPKPYQPPRNPSHYDPDHVYESRVQYGPQRQYPPQDIQGRYPSEHFEPWNQHHPGPGIPYQGGLYTNGRDQYQQGYREGNRDYERAVQVNTSPLRSGPDDDPWEDDA